MNSSSPELPQDAAVELGEPLSLRAGPLSLQHEDGGLRYLRLGEREVIRRIYIAVRDRNWGTVPLQITPLHQLVRAKSFSLAYDVRACRDDIDFHWRAEITGSASGRIVFKMDGKAHTDFLRNRIGFCILHPPRECRGVRCRLRGTDGNWRESRFPTSVSPDNPFVDFTGIAHEISQDTWCSLEFEGEHFEMEDQRNWLDASFKTFCTPLHLPFPVTVNKGTRVCQTVRLDWVGAPPAATARPATGAITLSLGKGDRTTLPRLGISMASHGQPLSAAEIARLAPMRPSHLRVELHLANPDAGDRLRQAALEAGALNCPLEIALFVGAAPEAELKTLAGLLRSLRPRIARWLVFHERELASADTRWLDLARRHLQEVAPGASFGAGTDHWFVYFNRSRPPTAVDHLGFSVTPQVHARDLASLVETLETHTDVIARAREIAPGVPLVISPVTLRMRTNPAATGSACAIAPGDLPDHVDPRQCSLFGAGWTLGSIKYLAEAGVASATYYETSGWCGVVETDAGTPLPARFPSVAGGVYPLFHVLADINEFQGGSVIPTRSSDPLKVEMLALELAGRRRQIVANLTSSSQTVKLPRPGHNPVMRRLNAATVPQAMRSPEQFRISDQQWTECGQDFCLVLSPFELVRIDSTAVA